MRQPNFLLLIAIICFSSCKPDKTNEQRWNEKAYNKQKTAITLMTQLEEKLESSAYPNKDSLLQAIETLEESLFAIPGYELNRTGHEGHNHDHSNIALSAEEIYKVQEELIKQLNQIQTILNIP